MSEHLTRVLSLPLAVCIAIVGAVFLHQAAGGEGAGRGGLEHPPGAPGYAHDPFAGARAGALLAASAAAASNDGPGETIDTTQQMFDTQLDSSRQRLLQAMNDAETIGDSTLRLAIVAADEAVGRVGEAAAAAFEGLRAALAAKTDLTPARAAAEAHLTGAGAELDSAFAVAKGAFGAPDTNPETTAVLDEIHDTVLDAGGEATGALTDARSAIESLAVAAGPSSP